MIPGKEEKGRGESESRREERIIKDELQRSPLYIVQQLTRVLLSLGELSDKTQLSPHSSTAENSLPHIDRLCSTQPLIDIQNVLRITIQDRRLGPLSTSPYPIGHITSSNQENDIPLSLPHAIG